MHAAASAAAARIGPNAIIRTAEALHDDVGPGRLAELFRAAGLQSYLQAPPSQMVCEAEVTRLQQVLRAQLGPRHAARVLRAAGERTGAYLLARRIPAPVRWLLPRLPAALASRVLVQAIRRNAWTFAGSAGFSASGARPVRFTLTACVLCRDATSEEPCCDFYTGCFEVLFRALVHPAARAAETHCHATGAAACQFELRW